MYKTTGAFIELRDLSWGPAIEGVIEKMVIAFAVHDTHDAGILQQILKQTHSTYVPVVCFDSVNFDFKSNRSTYRSFRHLQLVFIVNGRKINRRRASRLLLI